MPLRDSTSVAAFASRLFLSFCVYAVREKLFTKWIIMSANVDAWRSTGNAMLCGRPMGEIPQKYG